MPTTMSVKNMVKLQDLKNKRIEEPWCERHQKDFQQIIDFVENLTESAKYCNRDQLSQDLLVTGKKEFVELLMQIGSNYRHVAEEV